MTDRYEVPLTVTYADTGRRETIVTIVRAQSMTEAREAAVTKVRDSGAYGSVEAFLASGDEPGKE